jgi:hypothetical protein
MRTTMTQVVTNVVNRHQGSQIFNASVRRADDELLGQNLGEFRAAPASDGQQ